MRILIIGWPHSGKTTLAKRLSKELKLKHFSTDPQSFADLDKVKGIPNKLSWSEASQYVADKLLGTPDSVIEGVALPRALRKWKKANPGKPPPADVVIDLGDKTHTRLKPGHKSMGKGIQTVMTGLQVWLDQKKDRNPASKVNQLIRKNNELAGT